MPERPKMVPGAQELAPRQLSGGRCLTSASFLLSEVSVHEGLLLARAITDERLPLCNYSVNETRSSSQHQRPITTPARIHN